MAKVSNPRFPHTVQILRGADFDQFGTSETPTYTTIYEGVCRGYQQEYVKTTGVVMQSVRCLAIPIKNKEWNGNLPMENDLVILNNGDTVEKGRVIDQQPNNFGTNIYWAYERN